MARLRIMTPFGHIKEIWRYPVSSMGGERLDGTELAEGGIPGDRIWGIVDRRDGIVAAPEKRKHWRPLPNVLARLKGDRPEIGLDDGTWIDAGSSLADELVSAFLDFPAALHPHVPFGSEAQDHIAPRYQRADIHIVTSASMNRLAGLLPDPSQVDSKRFRPNIVIETNASQDGFVEQQIIGKVLSIGEARIMISESCARCTFTALAQGDLAFEPAVLQTIARHGEGGFGALCQVMQSAKIGLGDRVTLNEA
ncbi:MOSC domain-containing protein [Mesorhizobium sp.]|uniref:MOSC domain-containing protein n=1 Tax=Mesorhizobium sp. TaxID=1871066 RepID=UPI0025D63070|nr:MOSC domain-containing protein [Mesorhizobium sp.]